MAWQAAAARMHAAQDLPGGGSGTGRLGKIGSAGHGAWTRGGGIRSCYAPHGDVAATGAGGWHGAAGAGGVLWSTVSVEADADSPLLRTFVFAQRSPEEEALRPGDRAAPSAVEVL